MRDIAASLLVLILVGCGATRPMDVWVGDPATRRPFSNVAVELTYDSWPRWPDWLAWMPSDTPEPARAVTGSKGVATLLVETDEQPLELIVAGRSFAFERVYLDQGAQFKTTRLYVVVQPVEP